MVGRDFNSLSSAWRRSSLFSCASRIFFAQDGVLFGVSEQLEDLDRHSFLDRVFWQELLDDTR